jgi:hypothetical protein
MSFRIIKISNGEEEIIYASNDDLVGILVKEGSCPCV